MWGSSFWFCIFFHIRNGIDLNLNCRCVWYIHANLIFFYLQILHEYFPIDLVYGFAQSRRSPHGRRFHFLRLSLSLFCYYYYLLVLSHKLVTRNNELHLWSSTFSKLWPTWLYSTNNESKHIDKTMQRVCCCRCVSEIVGEGEKERGSVAVRFEINII